MVGEKFEVTMKRRIPLTVKQSIFHKPSPDDWHPNYPDGTVHVASYIYDDGMRRICVWGQDDTGMELDTYDDAKAELLLRQLNSSGMITMQMLLELGFVWA
jgi:hypothetical protein